MAEIDFGRLTEDEFERDIDYRTPVDELQESDWYMAREKSKVAERVGAFALEKLVVVKELDGRYDSFYVSYDIWNNEQGVIGNETVLMNLDGLIVDPMSMEPRGYFIEPGDNSDNSGVTEDEKRNVLVVSH